MRWGLNPSFESASGALGRIVFFALGGRQFSRRLVIPDNPRSALQQSIRAFMSLASTAYNSLTDSEKADWATLAAALTRTDALGDSYNPTAKGIYGGVNTTRQIHAQAISDVAPAAVVAAAVTGISSLSTSLAANLEVQIAHGLTAGFLQIEISPAKVGQRVPTEGEAVLADKVTLSNNIVAVAASPQTISIATANIGFTPVVGDQLRITITSFSDGYVKGGQRTEIVTLAEV